MNLPDTEQEQRSILKKENKGLLANIFGEDKVSCLNPQILKRLFEDSKVTLSFTTLVACDTLDELYHGLYDATLISALRFAVWASVVADAIKKTVDAVAVEEEAKIDKIIQGYFEYRN